ncbi:unnamed protein product [Amoebophrya sp. A120]|nr:unnamed protein product [Amoebophrya sp. A120]|eukprot:GSA120T00000243001.1
MPISASTSFAGLLAAYLTTSYSPRCCLEVAALPARDIASKMVDATSVLTSMSKDFNHIVLGDNLVHFVTDAKQLLEQYLAEAKIKRQRTNAQRNHADVTRKTSEKELEIQVDDLDDAKEKFVEFMQGVKNGALSGDDAKNAAAAQAAALQNVLNVISSEPGAGVLKGALEQMIQDTNEDGSQAEQKAAELAALTQDAVKKLQGSLDLTTEQIDLLLERQTNSTADYFKNKYVSDAIDKVLALSREDLVLFEDLDAKVKPMERTNVEKLQLISQQSLEMFKLAKDVETYEQCVSAGGNSPDHCLGQIGRTYASGMAPKEDPNIISYIGCFRDKGRRAMPVKRSGSFTVKRCSEACGADFQFFGVQYGSECFCARSASEYAKYGEKPEKDCQGPGRSPKCVDGSDTHCGGPWRNAVYKQPKSMVGLFFLQGKQSRVGGGQLQLVASANNRQQKPKSYSFLQTDARNKNQQNYRTSSSTFFSAGTGNKNSKPIIAKISSTKKKLALARNRLRNAVTNFSKMNKAEIIESSAPSPIFRAVEEEAPAGAGATSSSTSIMGADSNSDEDGAAGSTTGTTAGTGAVAAKQETLAQQKKIQLASDLLRNVGLALRDPAMQEFGKRMNKNDLQTNLNALNLFAQQKVDSTGGAVLATTSTFSMFSSGAAASTSTTTSSRQTPCTTAALDAAREKVSTALDMKLKEEKKLVDAKGKLAVQEAIGSVSETSKKLENHLLELGGETWQKVDSKCQEILTKLDEEKKVVFEELTTLASQNATAASDESNAAAGVILPKLLAEEVTHKVARFEEEVTDFRDHLGEQCLNHAIEIMTTIENHMGSELYESTTGASAEEFATVKQDVVDQESEVEKAKTALSAARKEFDDLASSCPGSPAESSGAVSLAAIRFAEKVLESGAELKPEVGAMTV